MKEECSHEIVDRYADGFAECVMCGTQLAGLALKNLGLEPELIKEQPDEPR